MYDLVQRHFTDFGNSANKVLMEAGAIALGIILASYISKFIRNIQLHLIRHA